ncbi:C40 family peptidase [Streptomyces albidoflavus]|uniref:C40 family peptidase n=1 Tax=Streptomyces albidoflavus TaxID=1886 RepID=UPI0033BBF2A5
MASHRKPRFRKLAVNLPAPGRLTPGASLRTATATALALAGAAGSVVAGAPVAQAAPGPTTAQVKAKVDRLHREAEIATEKYNGAKEKADKAEQRLDRLQDEAARRTAQLNQARTALGATAAAQYRAGAVDPAVELFLTSDPDGYLDRAARADRAAGRQSAQIAGVRQKMRAVDQLRTEADTVLAGLEKRRGELRTHKKTVTGKLAESRALLARLTAAERAEVTGETPRASRDQARPAAAPAAPAAGAVKAPNSRAVQAIAFAHTAIGKPYVWGATGPNAFDCSGLTQAAWRAAGVSLPRTTYTQINAGQRVSRSQLAPGDLVFFYSSISHVGLYIGNGQMIHAPNPNAPVRVAPISEMPFAGATRVG